MWAVDVGEEGQCWGRGAGRMAAGAVTRRGSDSHRIWKSKSGTQGLTPDLGGRNFWAAAIEG